MFSLMSRRTRKDYTRVLKAIKKKMPTRGAHLKQVVVDYEMALWQAVRDVFGDSVDVKGCVFHWTQAVWRKCQLLGLQSQYSSDGALQSYVRKLLALPFLPAEHVEPTFQKLQSRATPGPLTELCSYISTTWLSGFWTPVDWSVFGRSIRTNNDVEGWHRRLNHKSSRPGLPLYLLIQLLHQEAKTVSLQMKLVKEAKLCRYQRKLYKRLQGQVFKLWQRYEDGELKTSQLLAACSRLHGPAF